jgi:hypothetical protein
MGFKLGIYSDAGVYETTFFYGQWR